MRLAARAYARTLDRDLALARDLTSALARDLTSANTTVRDLALDVNRDLARARAFEHEIMRAHALTAAQVLASALLRDLAHARELAYALVGDRALANASTLAHALAHALHRSHALERELTSARVHPLNRTRDLASALVGNLVHDRDLAYARAADARDRHHASVVAPACDRRSAASGASTVVAGSTRSIPGRITRRAVALAVWLLPVAQRPRYREEFGVELIELPGWQRWGYALRVLACAWELRKALSESVRTLDGEPARGAER